MGTNWNTEYFIWTSGNTFTMRVTEPWHRLPRKVVESPSLAIFKSEHAPGLTDLSVSLWLQGLDKVTSLFPSDLKNILWFCDSTNERNGRNNTTLSACIFKRTISAILAYGAKSIKITLLQDHWFPRKSKCHRVLDYEDIVYLEAFHAMVLSPYCSLLKAKGIFICKGTLLHSSSYFCFLWEYTLICCSKNI